MKEENAIKLHTIKIRYKRYNQIKKYIGYILIGFQKNKQILPTKHFNKRMKI